MLMHSIREMCSPGALVISRWSGPEDIDAEKRWLKPLMGSLVHMAMQDGATKLALGVARDTQKPWMKIFAPHWYRQPIWCDLVPPEAYCYPTMLQVCLSLAELDQGLPIKGMIPAIKQRKRMHLELTVDTIDSFQIAWEAVYALDRAQSKTSYPEEDEACDCGSDGDAAKPA